MQNTLTYSYKNSCIIHINSTQNNTILTATDLKGQLLKTSSVGSVLKSKRGKRSVPQGALLSGEFLGSFLIDNGFSTGQIRIKGFGVGREKAVQGLLGSGLQIIDILDITRVPHNGCRPRKIRRI